MLLSAWGVKNATARFPSLEGVMGEARKAKGSVSKTGFMKGRDFKRNSVFSALNLKFLEPGDDSQDKG